MLGQGQGVRAGHNPRRFRPRGVAFQGDGGVEFDIVGEGRHALCVGEAEGRDHMEGALMHALQHVDGAETVLRQAVGDLDQHRPVRPVRPARHHRSGPDGRRREGFRDGLRLVGGTAFGAKVGIFQHGHDLVARPVEGDQLGLGCDGSIKSDRSRAETAAQVGLIKEPSINAVTVRWLERHEHPAAGVVDIDRNKAVFSLQPRRGGGEARGRCGRSTSGEGGPGDEGQRRRRHACEGPSDHV